MRVPSIGVGVVILTVGLMCIICPAYADTASATTTTSPFNVSWAALDPGNDWAAQVVRSIFPGTGLGNGTSTGTAATVVQTILGQVSGFVAAIACLWVSYNLIMHIHRGAESGQLIGTGRSTISVVRIGLAAAMMMPMSNGVSAGQTLVMQGALLGVGMAKAVYSNAITAVGPDAVVIAQPMIPGTQRIVSGLIQNELCMSLINLASNTTSTTPLVVIPQPITSHVIQNSYTSNPLGGYVTYRYSLSTGNETGGPVCGTVTLNTALAQPPSIAGQPVDMAGVQEAILNNVLTGYIRNQVASVALNFWTTHQAAALSPLMAIYQNAVNNYTSGLTAAAQSTANNIRTAITSNVTNVRNGSSDLIQGQVAQNTIGWTGAGAYYLEIAQANSLTLSLLNNVPIVTPPTYAGLGPALTSDLAPMMTAAGRFLATLSYIAQTQDGSSPPAGVPTSFADAQNQLADQGILNSILGQMNITNTLLQAIVGMISPSSQYWTDPFGGLMNLGQILVNTALTAMGLAAVLASATTSTGSALLEFITFNWGAAAATIAGHAVMSFLAIPLYLALLGLLIPGLIISYVLPMIPWAMWMAGVAGWIILVCEAVVAVPLWMLAHMTLGGDGLHGRSTEGWSLLFNVVFRPTIMVVGLFLSYFVFDCMSWLIRMTFGVAAGFALKNGNLVTNLLGIEILLTIFVMAHVAAAIQSFRMVAQLPHHLPRLIGFTAANRVDMEDFAEQSTLTPTATTARFTQETLQTGSSQFRNHMKHLSGGDTGRISAPGGEAGEARRVGGPMDSTLRAATDTGDGKGKDDV